MALAVPCIPTISSRYFGSPFFFPSRRADLKSIKRRIDNLIDREYLRRREGQPNMYEYLA